MSRWLNRLELIDIWKKYRADKIAIAEAGKEVAKRIRKLKCFEAEKETLEDIACDFECVETVEDFDSVLNDLYDWGDTPLDNRFGGKKLCWIATR